MATQIINPEMDVLISSVEQLKADIQTLHTPLAAMPAGITALKESKADPNGSYPSMTAGAALDVVGSTPTTDTTPYLFRRSFMGGIEKPTLIGGTVAWNQLAIVNKPEGNSNGVTWSTNDNIVTMSSDGSLTTVLYIPICQTALRVVSGHKYAFFGAFQEVLNYASGSMYITNDNINVICPQNGTIFQSNQSSDRKNITIIIKAGDSFTNYKYRPQIIDLTLMFGSTIADYIYSLEQATAGAGVQWIRDNCPKLLEWHPYDAGSLISVKPTEHKMVGKNLCPKFTTQTKNGATFTVNPDGTISLSGTATAQTSITVGIAMMPSGTYTISGAPSGSVVGKYDIYVKDLSTNIVIGRDYDNATQKTFTLSKPTTLQIEVRVDAGALDINKVFKPQLEFGSTATEYEPYEAYEYSLGSDELRGIPQLTDGKLTYDGDIKTADGQIVRKYTEPIDLGTLTWYSFGNAELYGGLFYSDSIMSVIKHDSDNDIYCVCSMFVAVQNTFNGRIGQSNEMPNNTIRVRTSDGRLYIRADSHIGKTGAAFKAAMSGVYLVAERATPTTEQGTAYSPYQRVSADGTEEFVDERAVAVPVGNSTEYYKSLVDALEGIPDAPTADGSYVLKVTVTGGVPTYSWEAQG